MTPEKSKTPGAKRSSISASSPPRNPAGPSAPPPKPVPLFRGIDWICFGVTTLLVLLGYLWTLAPDLTLEDSGELAVGSYYAGVPHPPGYPVWTIYSWLFTVLVPISNIAWRVALSSAVAGALSCGLIALMVSRGSSMMLEGLAEFKNIAKTLENSICMVSGFVAGMLMGFNGFMWSQAVIVEVYTLSVLSLAGVLCALLRWIYAPHQHRYLYIAWFLFGICFNNHQSLLVTALALEVAIAVVDPRIGRDLFLGNFALYVAGLIGKKMGLVTTLNDNAPLLIIYNLIGIGSGIACIWLWTKTKRIGTALHFGVFCFVAFCLGAAFYVYMPLGSMSNPPMNWGYARTVTGFFHAFTRGQYERIHPTTGTGESFLEIFISFIQRYLKQFGLLVDGAVEEFNPIYLLIGLVAIIPFFYIRKPNEQETKWLKGISIFFAGFAVLGLVGRLIHHLTVLGRGLSSAEIAFWLTAVGLLYEVSLVVFFLRYLQKRERAWLTGLLAFYAVLGPFLLVLLNPATDRQSLSLNRVFFTASHVMIAMGIGYALTLLLAVLITHYERFRVAVAVSFSVIAFVALYGVALVLQQTPYPILRYTALFGFILALLLAVTLLLARNRLPFAALLGLLALMPVYSVLSHWAFNEQRGHLFGFWFGHDMFTPPFKGADGKPIYPEMARDAILFGGTDPGRFCPTYMIFCESFIPDHKKRDPDFDRRDVYIITQNALADGTYLSYIRAHYNRSTQIDPPFFQELVRGAKEREDNYKTNILARMMVPVDRLFTGLGKRIEDRRRREGVYPPVEINTPSNEDSQRCFSEYMADAQKRMQTGQLKLGEDVRVIENRVQVSGQVAVMAINGLLTKVIFDKNPTNEFYVEESFPLEWMYEYLSPFGIIMKINREKLPEITDEMVQKDHEFWSQYSERLIGNWITYDTPISNICSFAERTYVKHDYRNYKGDMKFMRDDDGQKAFSKLRSSIAGLYAWRFENSFRTQNGLEQQRMLKEAEFSFKQAYAFCPYSPEALFRYVNLLVRVGRFDEARLLAVTSQKLDPDNGQIDGLIKQLDSFKKQQPAAAATPTQLQQLEAAYRANPSNIQTVLQLAAALAQIGQTNRVVQLADQVLNTPNVDANAVFFTVQVYSQVADYPRLEMALQRLTAVNPSPESWMDLGAIQAMLNKPKEAVASLQKALQANSARLAANPQASNLALTLRSDPRLGILRGSPEFQQLLATNK